MLVNYDEVMRQIKVRAALNRLSFEEIEWVRDDGTKIEFDKRLAEEWKFFGLSNVNFPELVLSRVVAGEQKELLEELVWKIDS
jgi:hypothetical protein